MQRVAAGVEGDFLMRWPFPDERSKKKFLAAGFSRVTCLYFPLALNDRIHFACRLLTILFLIDDLLEDMSFEDGEAYNNQLMPVMAGEVQPNPDRAVEVMMWEMWEGMRQCDRDLSDKTLADTFIFMRAQTDRSRAAIRNLGQYLEYRERDVGKALLSALMCFSMGLRLTPEEYTSVRSLERNCAKQISVVNDICSWEKELAQSKSSQAEGSALCCAVRIVAEETCLGIPAAKRILWVMVREWSNRHDKMAALRESSDQGCSNAVKMYVKGLEYQMSGNEEWSLSTMRYIDLKPDQDERLDDVL
ncbi:Aristolochene synthase from penicillium Roqueforti [Teratosphaeria nubilosa]|uniref:Terpene synthase n=1 Tax=Teratosphaeria nubilosa TaxID=161662 RepID=A0A6G1KV48_9PEZI|nr:Aristolochene synthase from penicillium Roqueforti [Teratosphaeria nubilosa]